MNQIKAAKLREEVFLTLIEAAAKQGQFNRDVLKGGTDVQALAKHRSEEHTSELQSLS